MTEKLNSQQIIEVVKQVDNKMMELTIFRNEAMLPVDSGVQRNLHRLGIVRTTLRAVLGYEDLDIALEQDEMYEESHRIVRFRPEGTTEEPNSLEFLAKREQKFDDEKDNLRGLSVGD